MHGEKRGRNNRRIARTDETQEHVREALLGPQAHDRLGFRVQTHSVLAQVLAGQFPTEIQNSIGFRVAVVANVRGRLGEFLGDQWIGRIAGVTHP